MSRSCDTCQWWARGERGAVTLVEKADPPPAGTEGPRGPVAPGDPPQRRVAALVPQWDPEVWPPEDQTLTAAHGQCRVSPPAVGWPRTHRKDWCRLWEEKKP